MQGSYHLSPSHSKQTNKLNQNKNNVKIQLKISRYFLPKTCFFFILAVRGTRAVCCCHSSINQAFIFSTHMTCRSSMATLKRSGPPSVHVQLPQGDTDFLNQSVARLQFCNSPMKPKIICSLKSLIRNERVAEQYTTVFWVQEQYNQPVDFIKMTAVTVLLKILLWRKKIFYNLFCISIV